MLVAALSFLKHVGKIPLVATARKYALPDRNFDETFSGARFFSHMKHLLLLVAFAINAIAAGIQQPIPELKLTNGTVFRNVTIVRLDKTQVVLKSSAGTGPLNYTMIPEPLRSMMIAERDGAAHAASQPRAITGQVFVTTKGAGAYKFSGVSVVAYQAGIYDSAKSIVMSNGQSSGAALAAKWTLALDSCGKPLARTQTDGDGKFSLQLPNSSPVLVFCVATRMVGRDHEFNTWVIPNADSVCNMSGENSL